MTSGAIRSDSLLTFGHALAVLAMLGGVATVIYKIGTVEATLEAGLHQEQVLREADKETVNGKLDQQARTTAQISADVRELRSYMMVRGQFPEPKR